MDLDMQDKKEIKFDNTSWSFKTDPVSLYAYWDNAFTKEECDKIIDIANNKGLVNGKVEAMRLGKADEDQKKTRDSSISWLNPTDNLEWFYRRLTDIITELNENYFKFDLFGINEGLQFTNYKSPGGKYGKHVDAGGEMAVRKLSVSIQLTNPDEYEGGELCLYGGEKPEVMKKTQGTLVMFPSYVLHEVTPVTKGERNSLVLWVTGPAFK